MKILISSHAFAPSIGGIETVGELLAAEFVRLGHSVTVVTQTAAEGTDDLPYSVVRQPSLRTLFRVIQWSDIFWHNNLSLRTLWPAFLLSKPIVITHQGSYCPAPQGIDLGLRLKQAIVRHNPSVASSKAIAACFATDSTLIYNPYDVRKFSPDASETERTRDLVFLGRLVSEKGVDLLLEALAVLRTRHLFPNLTIVGGGPELASLEQLVVHLDLSEQVTFSGPQRDAALRNLLRQHKVMVVPSRYDEPFGVVALEGIASGCVVIGSQGGGLPEAIGPCGRTFPNGDVTALANALESILGAPGEHERCLAHAPQHLAKFHPTAVAESYLALFRAKLS